MGKIHKLSTPKTVSEAAGLWLSRLDRGLNEQETAELQAWLSRDPSHQQVFLAMARSWDEMGSLEALADLYPGPSPCQETGKRPLIAVAASVIAAACLLGWIVVANFQSDSESELVERMVVERSELSYETGIGEQSTTVLPDGSTIVLNTNSFVVVRYSSHHRVLELVRGEVHVEVVPDRRRPLTVLAGDNIVQAVGTAFGVQLIEHNRVELVVTEGEVLVGKGNRRSRAADQMLAAPVLPQTALRVAQGEELLLGVETPTVKPVSADDIEVKMSWRQGNLVFRGERLADALKEVERYTTLRFSFENPGLGSQLLTGRYRAGDVDSFLTALGESHNISYERTDDGRVLLGQL